jgi:hypothetical protein
MNANASAGVNKKSHGTVKKRIQPQTETLATLRIGEVASVGNKESPD